MSEENKETGPTKIFTSIITVVGIVCGAYALYRGWQGDGNWELIYTSWDFAATSLIAIVVLVSTLPRILNRPSPNPETNTPSTPTHNTQISQGNSGTTVQIQGNKNKVSINSSSWVPIILSLILFLLVIALVILFLFPSLSANAGLFDPAITSLF